MKQRALPTLITLGRAPKRVRSKKLQTGLIHVYQNAGETYQKETGPPQSHWCLD